ncbi:MAG TPA: sigma-70 family RNA polymerase sigma factor [Solirubrobacteraceae bacterium]|nr:sigma-70 family RNA polymerase sigma factor [Solirubrobacteraceae bacterium]
MTASHASDRDLVVRCLDEPGAFEEVFERHFGAIYRYVARRLSPACADDVAAQVFCVAYDKRRQFAEQRPDCPLAPWLFGIATNLVHRHRRDERRQLRAYARVRAEVASPDSPDDAAARLDAQRARPAVARALASLSPDERDVLLLYALADLDYQGIADALEIPIGTVRSRLARARARARRHLGGDAEHLTPTAATGTEGR